MAHGFTSFKTAILFLDNEHMLEFMVASSSKLRKHYVRIPVEVWRTEWHQLIRHIKTLADDE